MSWVTHTNWCTTSPWRDGLDDALPTRRVRTLACVLSSQRVCADITFMPPRCELHGIEMGELPPKRIGCTGPFETMWQCAQCEADELELDRRLSGFDTRIGQRQRESDGRFSILASFAWERTSRLLWLWKPDSRSWEPRGAFESAEIAWAELSADGWSWMAIEVQRDQLRELKPGTNVRGTGVKSSS